MHLATREASTSEAMVTRPAEPSDAQALARMGKRFFDGTPLSKFTVFDPYSLMKLAASVTDSMQVFVLEVGGEVVGAVAGVVYPLLFNSEYIVGQELFWWVDESHRKGLAGRKLHRHLEDWAKSAGAKSMIMIAIENDQVGKVERLYNHYGYTKVEHSFMKEI